MSSQSFSLAGPSVDAQSDLVYDNSNGSGNGNASLSMSDLANNEVYQNTTIPQLIMPSLTVPRRRPFSEVGKSLGKLKIMVAGQTGK